MSKTSVAWLIGYLGFALLAFYHPMFGLVAYFQDYYAHPPLRWWGDELPFQLRWSMTIALLTLVSYLLRRSSLAELKEESHPQTKWLVFLVLNAVVVTLLGAVWEEKSWEDTANFAKLTVLYFLIIGTVRTEKHFRYLVIIHILGVLDWGWTAFNDPKRDAGRLGGIGGPDSFNDNATAVHLLAILPFIGYVFFEGKRWEKLLCLISAPFVVNTFILTNSRGGFIGLLLMGAVAPLISRGALRRKTLLGMLLGGCLLFSLADPQFIERQQSLQNYQEDEAADQRLASWKGALNLIADHPIGTGGGGFNALSPIYIPEIVEAHEGQPRSVHNTYLQAASEWGIQGLILFLGFLIVSLRELHRLRRDPPTTPEQRRLYAMSIAIELGLVGMITAGMFGSRLQTESIYWFAGYISVLRNLYAKEREKIADHQHALPS